MAVKTHNTDILDHINGPETLAGQAVANSACISLLEVIKVCADLQGESVKLKVYLAGVEIGSGTIDLAHPTITFGGGALGYKAEITITLETNPFALKICGKVSSPFGSKSGCTILNL